MKNKTFSRFIIFLGFLPLFLTANTVVKAPGSLKSLDAGWDWAIKQAGSGSGFYVAYTIRRLMGEHSYMGSRCSDSESYTTLYEIVTGEKIKRARNEKSTAELAKEMLEQKKTTSSPGKKVLKDVAFLFRYSGAHKGKFDCQAVKMSNLKQYVELEAGTIYWLGRAEQKESLLFLDKFFTKTGSDKTRGKIVTAVGMHGADPAAFAFLKKTIYGNYPDKIRKDAIFWIGEHKTVKTLTLLLDRVRKDSSQEVKEQAVFSIYRIDLTEADNALIDLAKKETDRKVRKKAIFWLGQKACALSGKVLGGIVKDDPDTEIQKQAVFALSQLPKGSGIPELIKISKNHKKMAVRKQAIFWLGESGDPRALDTIIEILKTGKK
jgi:hypothetical protein